MLYSSANGVIELDQPGQVPDGTRVEVTFPEQPPGEESKPSLFPKALQGEFGALTRG